MNHLNERHLYRTSNYTTTHTHWYWYCGQHCCVLLCIQCMNNRLDPGSTNWPTNPSTQIVLAHPGRSSLSLPLFLSLSLPFVFCHFVFSSFFVSVRLSFSSSFFLFLPFMFIFPSRSPSLPLLLFPSIIIYWRTGTKNNHTRHFSVIFKGVLSGY